MKKLHLISLLVTVALSSLAQTVGEAFYIYRNDGDFNAFFRDEIDSISYSNYDADSIYFDEAVMQIVYTQDSIYRIPLAAIDSVAFNVNDIVISQDYIPINENDYSIVTADAEKGEFLLAFNGSMPKIQAGNVMTLIGDTLAYIVRVEEATVKGKELAIKSSIGDLGDIITNGSFTLSTEAQSATARLATKDNPHIFFPVELSYYDDNNQKKTIRKSIKRDIEFTKRLYNYTIDYSGKEFFSNEHAKLYLESCRLDVNLDLVIRCNFNNAREAVGKYHKGELAIQKSVIRGNAKYDFMLRFDSHGSKEEEFPETMLKSNIHKPIVAKFIVAGVPVIVVMNTQLLTSGKYECIGDFSAYAGFATSTTLEAGVSWSQASGIKPYASFDSSFDIHKPTINGEAHLYEKVSVFPRITFSLYGLYGPSFDIKPYITSTQDLGFFDELGTNKGDYYGAKIDLFGGYDAAVGLSYMAFMANKPFLKSPSWNVVDKHLYEGPHAIKLANDSKQILSSGAPTPVSFLVTDYCPILNQEIGAIFPFMVKFETNCGTLNRDFSFVNIGTGLTSVEWTPSNKTNDGKSPYLLALMHDSKGNVIAADRWKPEIKAPILPPLAITSDCLEATENTATVSCSYENVPDNGVCGVEYTWSGGSLRKNIGKADGTQSITLSGLIPGNTYTYCAYIEANGQTYYGEDKTFTTEAVIPDIAGEWYCMEYNEDGSQKDKPYKITLFEDHTAKSERWGYNDSGKWSIEKGQVSIRFEWNNPYRYAYHWHIYGGTVNDLFSPSRIEGTKTEATQVADPEYHFIMTR